MHTKGENLMSRPKRLRRVCFLPEYTSFGVTEPEQNDVETLIMSIEEYESIRLIDLDGFDQEKAALTLDVSRGTLQRIYHKAKRKVAEMLVCGKPLVIQDGNIRLCDHPEHQSRKRCEDPDSTLYEEKK